MLILCRATVYLSKWQANVESCQRAVEPRDRTNAQQIKSFEILQKILHSQRNGENNVQNDMPILMLLEALHHVHNLTASFAALMNDEPDTTLIWGLIWVIMKVNCLIYTLAPCLTVYSCV